MWVVPSRRGKFCKPTSQLHFYTEYQAYCSWSMDIKDSSEVLYPSPKDDRYIGCLG